jgi:hypothetical protein
MITDDTTHSPERELDDTVKLLSENIQNEKYHPHYITISLHLVYPIAYYVGTKIAR